MPLLHHALRYGHRYGHRYLPKRFARAVPLIGTALALMAIGSAIRRKGVVGGTADSVLNVIPFIGGMKVLAEMVRGKEFFADRRPVPR